MRDQRRAPFAFQELPSTALIRDAFSGQMRMAALAIYQSMTEIANEQRGREFTATRKAIAEKAGCSADTVDRYAERFIELGLLERERRQEGTVHLPNVWALLTPEGGRTSAATPRTSTPTPSRTSAATPPHVSGQGGRTSAARGSRTSAAHTRAHDTGVQEEQQEERRESASQTLSFEQERASAHASTSIDRARSLYATLTDPSDKRVLEQLVSVAQAHGLDSGWDPAAALDLVHNKFRNRDVAAEAEKFAAYYSPGGFGENRPIANLTARWREWLRRAPTLDTVTARAQAPSPVRAGVLAAEREAERRARSTERLAAAERVARGAA